MRAEPFELIGYCDLRAGEPALAVAAFEAARRRDPEAWQYAYGLTVARALAGQDPRPAIADGAPPQPAGAAGSGSRSARCRVAGPPRGGAPRAARRFRSRLRRGPC